MATRKKPSILDIGSAAAKEAKSHGTITIAEDSQSVVLSLVSGASAKVLLYGATVVSWKIQDRELLWLSEASALDGSKAVRGGIPLVFPVFGPPPAGTPVEKLPQHGFARTSKWNLLGRAEDEEGSVRVDFGLSSESLDEETKAKWPYDFGLIYSVTLRETSLETKIVVQNPGSGAFDFNVLFHTYLRIPDVSTIGVQGLNSLTYRDKTLGGTEHQESSEVIKITSQTDRVYKSAPDSIVVSDSDKPLYTVTKTGLEDVVLWNPYNDGVEKIGDWQPKEGYKNMVCVEAGSVAQWQTLESQSTWEGGVTHKAHL
ncbi:hypothetical protein AOL_s00215g327 [Orbilia oligospora ATCC 24927]|uniref:Glucose-6-phosphate 1-epimerase n=2 Tax=Orbilia oligospora TaxID=2813651 RepID=G1XU48_ARTOA|nr:hypothetical protein AOL_s00215g327 [Orbilia oligospora ATCC 24927]EGX43591.1 hypothetical protein AOL_s00215g327 [Orbilia oligospora ATCC 24927]KAF3275431.1 hypothetical protein TWF970_006879 [Orbilia oligospora]